MKTYELIDHTADVGIKAYGKTLSEAFENAAKGMFDIITDSSEIESIGQYNIELEAPDLEQLLVDWLSELLYLFEIHPEHTGHSAVDRVGRRLHCLPASLDEPEAVLKRKTARKTHRGVLAEAEPSG